MSKEKMNDSSCPGGGGCGSVDNESILKSNVPSNCSASVSSEDCAEESSSSNSSCPGGRGC